MRRISGIYYSRTGPRTKQSAEVLRRGRLLVGSDIYCLSGRGRSLRGI